MTMLRQAGGLLSLALALAIPGCSCPDYTSPIEQRALDISPVPAGWPNNVLCCGDGGRSEFEFATTYSWSSVALSWSSYKQLAVSVTLVHCQPRDAGDCSLARTVDNETTPDSYGAFKGEYGVSGQAIRLGVVVSNPERTNVPFGLRATESKGSETRSGDQCNVL